MTFLAIKSLPKGDIKASRVYEGSFVERAAGLRIVVYNSHLKWQSYDPKLFVPYEIKTALIGPEPLDQQLPLFR